MYCSDACVASRFPKWAADGFAGANASNPARLLPEGVTSLSLLAPRPCISNRYAVQTGLLLTPTKQTTVVLSNRYDPTPLVGVPSWLPSRPALCRSNRNTPETGFLLTPTKQTTVVLSNRNKKPPPRGSTFRVTPSPLDSAFYPVHRTNRNRCNPFKTNDGGVFYSIQKATPRGSGFLVTPSPDIPHF
jgi:hypothetical protein